jgi:hypothetical protein
MLPWVFSPFGLRGVWSGASGGRCCVPVAPEGVAFARWRVPVPFGWPPRGSPSGRWRRARVPVWGRRGCSEERLGCVAGRRWGSEELRWCSGRRASKSPCEAGSPRPRRGLGLSVPWSGSPRPRGGLGLSGRGVGPPGVLPRKGGWGVQGDARLATSPLRGGAAAPAASVGPPPRGGVGSRRPPVARRARGASPSGPCCRRASAFRGRSSALRRGVMSTRRGRTSWLLRRGGAVRFRVGAGGAEAPSLPRRVRVGLAGAEAPVGRLRGPLRGLSAPPKGGGRPGAACAVVPSSPRAFRSLCVAEAQQSRHGVPFFPLARGLVGVPALPKRGRADTSRPTEVGWVRFRRGGPGGCVLGCPRTRRRGRRCAEARCLRSPVVGRGPVGELPVAGRGPGSGGGRVLSVALRQAARRLRGGFPPLGTRQGDGSVGGKLESHTLKGCGHVKEQPEDCCCR